VIVIDRRDHIGGNSYDEKDHHSILIHKCDPHVFYTNLVEVYKYLSNFTEWYPYEHHILTSVNGMLLPIPINLDTINKLYSLNLNE
jgi:UDP-galactopyranose mutase